MKNREMKKVKFIFWLIGSFIGQLLIAYLVVSFTSKYKSISDLCLLLKNLYLILKKRIISISEWMSTFNYRKGFFIIIVLMVFLSALVWFCRQHISRKFYLYTIRRKFFKGD